MRQVLRWPKLFEGRIKTDRYSGDDGMGDGFFGDGDGDGDGGGEQFGLGHGWRYGTGGGTRYGKGGKANNVVGS